MFVLDSFLHWVLTTVTAAAEAEMHDDTALREQLLEAEMRRELGDISDEEFARLEADLLARIRAMAAARRQGSDPAPTPAAGLHRTAGATYAVEASVVGDFHETDGVEDGEPPGGRRGSHRQERAPAATGPTRRPARARATAAARRAASAGRHERAATVRVTRRRGGRTRP